MADQSEADERDDARGGSNASAIAPGTAAFGPARAVPRRARRPRVSPHSPTTGDPYAGDRRHLIATCRSVANFAVGALADGPDWCLDAAEHGLQFLREAHRADDGGYHLVVDAEGEPVDRTRSAYGHAFVLLAYARAVDAGIEGAERDLDATRELIDDRFRDDRGLLRSDCDADWTEREPYRGQNANMHACEAFLAAYEATDEARYLDRARHIAEAITVDLAAETDGLLWSTTPPTGSTTSRTTWTSRATSSGRRVPAGPPRGVGEAPRAARPVRGRGG